MSLVTSSWLAEHLHDPSVRVIDVRWYLPTTGKRGADAYAQGHIPGAVFADLDRDLAAPDDGSAGRHPLPAEDTFEDAMRRLGVSPGVHVVAYDDAGGSVAARLWWLLRAHGHREVSLLDGGLPAWTAEGRPLSTEVPQVAPGTFTSSWNPMAIVTLKEVRRALKEGALVLDARAAERYRGDVEPVDPRPGHIPGATSAPFSESLESGRFRSPEALAERFRALGVGRRPVIASCGSGVTACHHLFALDHAGIAPFGSARLYVGSYSEWSRKQDLPVATGDQPGEPA